MVTHKKHKMPNGHMMADKDMPKLTAAQGAKASAKMSHLAKHEPSMPAKQRIAMAMNMAREGRLGQGGAYKPASKKAKPRKRIG